MKNKFILPILSIFFMGVTSLYLLSLYFYTMQCDGWVIGDWLINYEAGFVRRGLSGFLIIGLSDLINLKPNITVGLIQTVLYVAYMSIFYFLSSRKKMTVWFCILLLSPVTLLFPILNMPATGRKEIILYFLFLLYVLLLEKKMMKSRLAILFFSAALLVATLFHELIFFYTPYFIVAAWLKSKIDNDPNTIGNVLPN